MNIQNTLEQAAALWQSGDSAGAALRAQQVLAVQPEHAGALNLAGCAAHQAANYGVALALLQKAVQYAPGDVSMACNLAHTEAAVGRTEAALRRMAYLAVQHAQAARVFQDIEGNWLKNRREYALAATFYVADASMLAAQVDGFVAQGSPPSGILAACPKIIVVPHAGHVYSGSVAGAAYAQIAPFAQDIRRVVMFGPAHRLYFQGIALPGAGALATPLGDMALDSLGADAIADLPFVAQRADAHAQEHCLEVQVPFLQRVVPHATLLPLLVGDASCEQVAQIMERLWGGPETLIVISTDLSHFHGYSQAQRIDSASCAKVLALDATLTHEQACGATPLNAALGVAKVRGMQATELARCNSGDTAGDKERVVGYASFALHAPLGDKVAIDFVATRAYSTGDMAINSFKNGALNLVQGAALVSAARVALHSAVGASMQDATDWTRQAAQPDFVAPGASFVTLTVHGQLRGCIGSLQAHRPLLADVQANAASAALHDTRFAPVSAAEAAGLQVEVSVLTAPEPMVCANESHALWQLQRGVDGLVLECEVQGRSHRSTYLPQVWEQIPEPRAFLAHLKVKAGLPADFWSPQMRLSRYRVQKFCESDPQDLGS